MKNKTQISTVIVVALLILFAGCNNFENNGLHDCIDTGSGPVIIAKPDYADALYKENEIMVRAVSQTELAELLLVLNSAILKSYEEIGWYLVDVPEDTDVFSFIDRLEKTKSVIIAEPHLKWELPVPDGAGREGLYFTGQPVVSEPGASDIDRLWGMKAIKADKAWDITTGSENVIIAIIDTGLDMDHPEFRDHTIIGAYETVGDGLGARDVQGHGTHVAGTAAANGRQGKLAGVAWDCPIMPIRVMREPGG